VAIASESDSIGFVTKHVDTWGVDILADRIQNFDFNTSQPNGFVLIRHLPEGEFLMHETPVPHSPVPLWFSLGSSAGLIDRTEPAMPTETTASSGFFDRVDLAPTITSNIRLAGFSLVPSFTVEETDYGSAHQTVYSPGASPFQAVLAGFLRSDRAFTLDLIPPSLEHIYNAPGWLGKKLKHVIEPEVEFRYVGGIGPTALRTYYFDQLDTLNDTKELRLSLTNRLYVKRKDNGVDEILSWQVSQVRYFDPTFGGAIIPGQPNVIWSSLELTPFTFVDGPRRYSPVTSLLRFQKRIGIDWQTDYDPMHNGFTDAIVNADIRYSKVFVSMGQSLVRQPLPITPGSSLPPTIDQFRGTVGFGQSDRRGLNSAVTWFYDYRQNLLTFIGGQVTYNTNCCGMGVEYRQNNWHGVLGIQNSTDVRFAFTVANMGSFGTLRRQDRLF
jgi:LPS-assembly protein